MRVRFWRRRPTRQPLVGLAKCAAGIHEVFDVPKPGETTTCLVCGRRLTAGGQL